MLRVVLNYIRNFFSYRQKNLILIPFVSEIIKEPKGGAHRNHDEMVANVTSSIKKNLNELMQISPEELIYQRKNRSINFY